MAYELRISDWSSDVCSSDLREREARGRHGDRWRFIHRLLGLSRVVDRRRAAHRLRKLAALAALRSRSCGRLHPQRRCTDAVYPLHRTQGGLAMADSAATPHGQRSEEHTSELQSLMRISYAVFCLK